MFIFSTTCLNLLAPQVASSRAGAGGGPKRDAAFQQDADASRSTSVSFVEGLTFSEIGTSDRREPNKRRCDWLEAPGGGHAHEAGCYTCLKWLR